MSLPNQCSQCNTYLGYKHGFCRTCGKELDRSPVAEDYPFVQKLTSEQIAYLSRGLHLTLPSFVPTHQEFINLCIACSISPQDVQRLIENGPAYIFGRS